MAFFCNPNNPTGVLTGRKMMKKLLDRCEETDTLLVVDECFMDFVDPEEQKKASLKCFLHDSSFPAASTAAGGPKGLILAEKSKKPGYWYISPPCLYILPLSVRMFSGPAQRRHRIYLIHLLFGKRKRKYVSVFVHALQRGSFYQRHNAFLQSDRVSSGSYAGSRFAVL